MMSLSWILLAFVCGILACILAGRMWNLFYTLLSRLRRIRVEIDLRNEEPLIPPKQITKGAINPVVPRQPLRGSTHSVLKRDKVSNRDADKK